MSNGQRFLVRRDDLTQIRIEPFDVAAVPLAPGAARFRIDHFAFSANNITYAVFGESMHYWSFFPATEGWGCIPVWGFAEVEASNCDALPPGQRCYGYWPMATHAVVEPVEVGAHGFVDGSAHRVDRPAIYNRYQRTAAGQELQREGAIALLRPLFATAWLIAEFLREAGCFGARTLLLSSASSKTGLATAFCLRRLPGSVAPRIAGATSPSRLGFVSGLRIYDELIAYDALSTLSPAEPTLYIDISGDAAFRRAVHRHWQDQLVYSCAVGATHHQAMGSAVGLPGPRPQFFFAPEQLRLRSAPPPQGMGRAALMQQIDAAWTAFIAHAAEGARPWLTIELQRGAEAMRAAYRDTLDGRIDPGRGLLLAF